MKRPNAIVAAEAAFNRGAISLERYEAIVSAAGEKLATLNGPAEEPNFGIDALGDGFEIGGEKASEFGSNVERLRGQLDGATSSAARFSVATSGGVRARSSRSQAAVNQALANGARPTLSGTRIRVRGGSRLLA